MADLSQLLAQLLGQREQEQPNLNPQAPSTIPGTRGLFARRPVQGRPSLGYGDVAPMPPQWAERGPQTIQAPQEINPFPFPMGGQEAPQVPVAPMPQAARVGISRPESPGAYASFPGYVNAQEVMGEPIRQTGPHIRADAGLRPSQPLAVRGLAPPNATEQLTPEYLQQRGPYRFEGRYLGGDRNLRSSWQSAPEPPASAYRPRTTRAETDLENDRFNRGLELARAAIQAERDYDMRHLPRQGRPLIGQAWADNTGSRLGTMAGVRGAPSRYNRRDGR